MVDNQLPYEKYLKLNGDGWKSDYTSINNLLRKIMRSTKSESTKKGYLTTLYRFCKQNNVNPDTVITWDKEQIQNTIQMFCDVDLAPTTKNLYMNQLNSFFSANNFRVGKHSSLFLEGYHVPSRYRKNTEYIPNDEDIKKMVNQSGSSLRDQVLILLLYTTGLRNSTLRALTWEDLDLDNNQGEPLLIKVTPEMKKIVPEACKGNIPYFTFCNKDTVEALKRYREQVKERYGIKPNQIIIFCNVNTIPLETRRYQPISGTSLPYVINRISRNAGIKEWQHIHPHVFRKSFERALRNSKMGTKDQEYLMGHILPGSQDTYYDNNIEDLREKYSKVMFFQDIKLNGLRTEVQKQHEEINELRQALAKSQEEQQKNMYAKEQLEENNQRYLNLEKTVNVLIVNSCSHVIEEMWSDNWFIEEKSLSDIEKEIRLRGYYYDTSIISEALKEPVIKNILKNVDKNNDYWYIQRKPRVTNN